MTRAEAIDRIKGWEETNQNFINRSPNQSTHYTEEMLNYFRQNSEIYNMCIEALSQPEQKKGKWVFSYFDGIPECSECGSTIKYPEMSRYWYCPNCGARMENGK